MPTIGYIQMPNGGNTYEIADIYARNQITDLANYTAYLGVTTTALTDGMSASYVLIGESRVSAVTGNIVNYGTKEFIYNGSIWQEFGDMGALGTLAYASKATGTSTPTGTVTVPVYTFSGSETNAEVTVASNTAVTNVTLQASTTTGAGRISYLTNVTASIVDAGATGYAVTDVGTVPSFTMSVSASSTTSGDTTGILMFSWNAGTTPTRTQGTVLLTGATVSVSQTTRYMYPSLTKASFTASGTFTPTGSISSSGIPSFYGSSMNITVYPDYN